MGAEAESAAIAEATTDVAEKPDLSFATTIARLQQEAAVFLEKEEEVYTQDNMFTENKSLKSKNAQLEQQISEKDKKIAELRELISSTVSYLSSNGRTVPKAIEKK